MAHLLAGTPAAAAHSAGVRTPRRRDHLGEPGRSSGFRSTCVSNSWAASMPANRSGVCFATWDWRLLRFGGWPGPMQVVCGTRGCADRNPPPDLRHGTNAAYVAGCVCKDCREHQQQRMGLSRS